MRTLLLHALFATALAAQDAAEPPRPNFVDTPFRGLAIDAARGDGQVWARASTYKVGFLPDGVRYLPGFGPQHPSLPMQFRLDTIRVGGTALPLATGAWQVDSSGVVSDHGSCRERWDLAPTQAEQSFHFASRLSGGDLVLELAVTTSLQLAGRDADGLVFAAGAAGTVHYGDAVLVDAKGRRTALVTTASPTRLAITVPAAVLADAAFPIVVDPILSTQAYDTTATDSVEPDLAYDATHDCWLLVNTDLVASNDGDIRCRRYSPAGTLLSDTFVETTSNNALRPSVANSRRHARFLVGWLESTSIVNADAVVREHSTTSAGLGSRVIVDSTVQGFGSIDVGGSSDTGGLFLVAWTPLQAVIGLFADVRCRTYAVGGTLGAVNFLANNIGCGETVSVSKSSGPGSHWGVAFNVNSAAGCLGGDIHAAVVAGNGTVAEPAFVVDGSNLDFDFTPQISGDGTHFVVAWRRGDNAPRQILGALLGPATGGFAKLTASLDLGQLEPNGNPSADQTSPRIEWDGCRYVLGYLEGSPPRPFYATLGFDGISPRFFEGHVACSTAGSTVAHSLIALASEGATGGDCGRVRAVWQQIGSNRDLRGIAIDVRNTTGGVTTLDTHCPLTVGLFTTIGVNGTPAIGRTFTVQLGNVAAAPFVLAGIAEPAVVTLCGSTAGTCRRGVRLPPFLTSFGSSLPVTVPCDLALVGVALAFQGVDFGASGGCSPALFGAPLRVTDTVVTRIQ